MNLATGLPTVLLVFLVSGCVGSATRAESLPWNLGEKGYIDLCSDLATQASLGSEERLWDLIQLGRLADGLHSEAVGEAVAKIRKSWGSSKFERVVTGYPQYAKNMVSEYLSVALEESRP